MENLLLFSKNIQQGLERCFCTHNSCQKKTKLDIYHWTFVALGVLCQNMSSSYLFCKDTLLKFIKKSGMIRS